MSRPTKKEQFLIEKRNRLIRICVKQGLTQSEVAKIFRLPRNTVSVIVATSKTTVNVSDDEVV